MFDETRFITFVESHISNPKTIITEEQRRQLTVAIQTAMTLSEETSESESETSDSAIGDEENAGDGMYLLNLHQITEWL